MRIPRPDQYELVTEYGLLDFCFTTKFLNRVPAPAAAPINIPDTTTSISSGTIAKRLATSDTLLVSCKCKGGCIRRCKCRKYKVKCTNYCHTGRDHSTWENMADIEHHNTRPIQKCQYPGTSVNVKEKPIAEDPQDEEIPLLV